MQILISLEFFLNTIWLIDKSASEIKGAKLAIQFTGYTTFTSKKHNEQCNNAANSRFPVFDSLNSRLGEKAFTKSFFVNLQKVFTVTLSKKNLISPCWSKVICQVKHYRLHPKELSRVCFVYDYFKTKRLHHYFPVMNSEYEVPSWRETRTMCSYSMLAQQSGALQNVEILLNFNR